MFSSADGEILGLWYEKLPSVPGHHFTSLSANISSLKTCYMGSRCTGMLIVHNDDTRSVLDQWYEDTNAKPHIKALSYQRDNVLRFHLTRDGYQFLSRVESLPAASSSPVSTGEIFVDVAYGDDIIWLFSQWHDRICRGSDL
ncbi:hypothetical protein P170DRAFT_461781 [Aspergillus steynii IBT 23096]|uniref:Uncharacterized protein n=1 Tax=Aspergillus steynii IBT 23096 TaxID=1392250 RepID=A0A2I2GFB9_9EURO|nr:uncharacterized protein P170DRAFT_461781 [Aspergillus steynii IBT 23096]PLB51576.1 hypothetical protein P170DRAFT_461781 [Aspergillus steynii IBT 23096]